MRAHSAEAEERGWQLVRDLLNDDEAYHTLRQGLSIILKSNKGNNYILYPSGRFIRAGRKKPAIKEGSVVIGKKFVEADYLATIIGWIKHDEDGLEKHWNCGNFSIQPRARRNPRYGRFVRQNNARIARDLRRVQQSRLERILSALAGILAAPFNMFGRRNRHKMLLFWMTIFYIGPGIGVFSPSLWGPTYPSLITQTFLGTPGIPFSGLNVTELSEQEWDPLEAYQNGVGMWWLHTTIFTSFDLEKSVECDVHWYTRENDMWVFHAVGDNAYVHASEAAEGYIYAVMLPPENYYVDIENTMYRNSYAVSWLYKDVDGNGYQEFAFKLDLRGHLIPTSGYPSFFFHGFLLRYSAFSLSSTTNNLTAETTVWKDICIHFNESCRAVALNKIQVEIEGDTTVLDRLMIPGRGYLSASDGKGGLLIQKTSSTVYSYVYGENLASAYYLLCEPDMPRFFDLDLKLRCLDVAYDVPITLKILYFDSDGMIHSKTSSFVLLASLEDES